ncbi:MAG: hypothetical protein H7Y11_15080, partial [Armatimonadetes bacterium]|nr:hypothetical protein [Anaerolineae bacterium]
MSAISKPLPPPAPNPNDLQDQYRASKQRATLGDYVYNLPLWFIILAIGWTLVFISIITNALYANIFGTLLEGVPMTLRVAASAYLIALSIGLVVGLIRAAPPVRGKNGFGRVLAYQLATLYVEVMRCDSNDSYAYSSLGALLSAGETVQLHDGRTLDKKALYVEALQCDSNYADAYDKLARSLSAGGYAISCTA